MGAGGGCHEELGYVRVGSPEREGIVHDVLMYMTAIKTSFEHRKATYSESILFNI